MSTANKLLQAASGNAGEAVFVEDVYATHIYTGNQTAHTLTTGIDLDGEGGLLWIKAYDGAGGTNEHVWLDTARGVNKYIRSNSSVAEATGSFTQTFTSTGFTLNTASALVNDGNTFYDSWSFRKQSKFFDVVTYTGTGGATTVSHNLGSVPGMILVKRTDSTKDWWAYHVGANGGVNPATKYIVFNENDAEVDSDTAWNDTAPTATEFSLGTSTNVNASGGSYVAYLFANGEADFGEDSDEAIIKCGHFSSDSGGAATVDIGFEPQWLMFKRRDSSTNGDWYVMDYLRGLHYYQNDSKFLAANRSNASSSVGAGVYQSGIHAWSLTASSNYIYVAIRRPQKVPEAGTEIFFPNAYTGNATAGRELAASAGFPHDLMVNQGRSAAYEPLVFDRVRGFKRRLYTYLTSAAGNVGTNVITRFNQAGHTVGTDADVNASSATYITHYFRRARKFMDIISYQGNSSARAMSHNLEVAPEIAFFKTTNMSDNWLVASTATTATMFLNTTNSESTSNYSSKFTSFTSSAINFSASSSSYVNESSRTYVAYLFATLPGVSKCGTYTGTGSAQNIDCGFSGTARFLLIKSRDEARGWFVYDSARGIVAGNDPYQLWNAAGTEVTSTDYIDPYAGGFALSGSNDLNVSSEKYLFLAIA